MLDILNSLDINFMQQHIFNLMSWLNIGKAFSDIENPPNPSRPLIISRCRMRHFINLWYPKSLFLSNFVLSLASFYSSIILHNSILCYYFKQPHLIWCLSISLIFWDKKPKNFRKCHSFFFVDHLRCPAYLPSAHLHQFEYFISWL
jgi:hypothetical protein